MKKKNLLFLPIVMLFSLTSCTGETSSVGGNSTVQPISTGQSTSGNKTDKPSSSAHKHDYSLIGYDENSHWYECECGARSINSADHSYHKEKAMLLDENDPDTIKVQCDVCDYSDSFNAIKSITVENTELTVEEGSSITVPLNVTWADKHKHNEPLYFLSSYPYIEYELDEDNVLTIRGVTAGAQHIKISAWHDILEEIVTLRIEVTPRPIPITKIEIEEDSIELTVNDGCIIEPTFTPADSSYAYLEYISENPSIAKVTALGENTYASIQGVSPGTTTIKVQYMHDPSVYDTVKVTVKEPEGYINFKEEAIYLTYSSSASIDFSQYLEYGNLTEGATIKYGVEGSVYWINPNEKTGVSSIKQPGIGVISATTSDSYAEKEISDSMAVVIMPDENIDYGDNLDGISEGAASKTGVEGLTYYSGKATVIAKAIPSYGVNRETGTLLLSDGVKTVLLYNENFGKNRFLDTFEVGDVVGITTSETLVRRYPSSVSESIYRTTNPTSNKYWTLEKLGTSESVTVENKVFDEDVGASFYAGNHDFGTEQISYTQTMKWNGARFIYADYYVDPKYSAKPEAELVKDAEYEVSFFPLYNESRNNIIDALVYSIEKV